MRRGKEGENNIGRGRREKETDAEKGGERERERERKNKRQDERINQCGRFTSLYTVHHAKLMERETDRQRERERERERESVKLGADVTTERCLHYESTQL